MNISIIIPALNEERALAENLQALQAYREKGHEVILVDGGSHDRSIGVSLPLTDRIIQTERSRAHQMNEGAIAARHEVLLFLHADTRLPEHFDTTLLSELERTGRDWGRFDIRLSSERPIFRFVERGINLRSAISGIATGDQAIFVRRELFEEVGCYDHIPLMEDVALSRKLRRHSRPLRLSGKALSSSRRWERYGLLRTMFLMWYLRAAYFCGADPQRLAKKYDRTPEDR